MKNGKFFLLVSLTLVLLSLTTVNAVTETDFVKITDGNVSYFTHKDIVNSRYIVGSDKIFYGSNTGQITMKIYLSDKNASGDYKIGLRTKSKNITIKSIGVGETPSPILSIASTSYDYPNIIKLGNTLTEVTITLEFDPLEIGILEKFDIILYDKFGNILVIYDPFLSGFDERYPINLTSVHGVVTTQKTYELTSINTSSWACSDNTGVTLGYNNDAVIDEIDLNIFGGTCGTDSLNFDFKAPFDIPVNEEFNSVDSNGLFFYVKSTDPSPDRNAFAVYLGYDNIEDGDLTSNLAWTQASGSWTASGSNPHTGSFSISQTGGAGNRLNSDFSVDTTSDINYSMWVNVVTLGNHQFQIGNSGLSTWTSVTIQAGFHCFRRDGSTPDITMGGSPDVNTWYQFVIQYNSGASTSDCYVFDASGNLIVSDLGGDQGTYTPAKVSLFSDSGEQSFYDDLKIINPIVPLNFTLGAQELGTNAGFTVSGTGGLDPENSITSVDRNFTNTSTPSDANFFWSVDGVQESTDVNFTRSFTSVGDFNISLLMDSAGTEFQQDQNISIVQLPQGIDLNFIYNTFTNANADVNYGVTFTGTVDSFNWGFPGDGNVLTRNVNKTYTTSGQKEVCVTTTTSDANKTVCENFFVGRVLVKIPLDSQTFVQLTTFDFTNSDFPFQSYASLNADTNVFVFRATTDFDSLIKIDFNTDYFSTSRLFTFNSFLHEYQSYLIADNGTNLEATIFTIDNAEGRVSISGIKIESFTDINGVSTLVESKFSDGTGQALFHFVKGQEYTLSFFDSSGTLLTTKTIEANDTQYFVFLNLIVTDPVPTPQFSVSVIYDPSFANVIPRADGNINFAPIIKPTNGTLIDINVFISHLSDANIVYNQVFTANSTGDFNLSFDFNVAGFNDNFPLTLNLQILDSSGNQVGTIFSKSYSFKGDAFQLAAERTKDAIGQFGVTLIALILVTFLIGQLTKRAIGEDTNFVVIPAMFLTGSFVFIGWIEFDVWASGVMFSVGLALWGVKK